MAVRRNTFALLLAIFSIGSQPALAADIVWTAPGDGDFGDAARWTPLQVPSTNDTAVFNTAGAYTVTFDHTPYSLANPVTNNRLSVAQGAVTFASGADGTYLYQLNSATLGSVAGVTNFNLGNNGAPVNMNVGNELIVQDGAVANVAFGSALNAGKVSIGTLPTDSGGTLILNGGASSGTQLNVSGTTTVGSYGTSMLAFGNGATGSLNRVDIGVFMSATGSGVSNFYVSSDADITVGDVFIGTGLSTSGAAGMTVSGSATSVTQPGASSLTIGSPAQTLTALSLDTGGAYIKGTGLTDVRGRGLLNIISSGTFSTAGDINLNANGDPNDQGKNLFLVGTLTQSGATNITVGAPGGGPGGALIGSSGTLSTGTGLLTINKTGTVSITSGTLLANGDVLIDGGLLSRNSSTQSFILAPGGTMTMQNGGRATFSGSYTTGIDGVYNVVGGGSRIDASTTLMINSGASVNVTAGGVVSAFTSLNIAGTLENTAGNGTLLVDGLGSFVSGGSSTWGTQGGTAQVTIRNNAMLTMNGTLNLATGSTPNFPPTTAVVSVENGGKLSTGSLALVNSSSTATTSATLTIAGAGSAVTLNQSGQLTVGGGSLGAATVNINDHAMLIVGSGTTIGANGTININGGVVDLKNTNKSPGGKINFNSGTLSMSNTSLTIGGSSSFFGDSLTLDPTKTLNLGTGSVTVNAGAFVTLQDGATFAPFNVNNSGEWDFNGVSNTLTTTQGFINSGIVRGNARMISSLNNNPQGQVSVGAGQRLQITKISSNAGRYDVIGTEASRAELEFDAMLTNQASTGLIAARSAVLRFPNSGSAAGLANSGALTLTGGTNDVFGDISNTGSITVTGGATATFYDDIAHNGTLQVSKVGNTNSLAIFLGSFTGAGSIAGGGDIFFEGDLRPGNSPASVNYNANVNFGAASKLQIELGGTTAGTQYDQVHVAGALTLGGALQVSLINSFSPALGNSFHVLDWQQRTGTFAALDLPTLGAPLAWSTNQLYSAGSLSVISVMPGDFNQDGALTGADISAMLSALTDRAAYESAKGFSDAQFLTLGDLDHSGAVTNADIQPLLDAIAAGQNGGGSALASVPEPSSVVILLLGMLTIAPSRKLVAWIRSGNSSPPAGCG